MANQFSQHHVSSLPHWFKLPPFSLSQFPHMFLFRFHWLVCLFLCQGHNALNAVASWYILISGSIKNPFLIFQTPFLEISWLFLFCFLTRSITLSHFVMLQKIIFLGFSLWSQRFCRVIGGHTPSFQDRERMRKRQTYRMTPRFWAWRPRGFGALKVEWNSVMPACPWAGQSDLEDWCGVQFRHPKLKMSMGSL